GHGNLAKGLGDRWSLELLLSAAPWITGGRTAEDKYLSTQLGAVEMVMKGCTACYDLSFEWPLPTAEGIGIGGQGLRRCRHAGGIAPMVADRSFYEAIPGLMDSHRFAEELRPIGRDAPLRSAQIHLALPHLHCQEVLDRIFFLKEP